MVDLDRILTVSDPTPIRECLVLHLGKPACYLSEVAHTSPSWRVCARRWSQGGPCFPEAEWPSWRQCLSLGILEQASPALSELFQRDRLPFLEIPDHCVRGIKEWKFSAVRFFLVLSRLDFSSFLSVINLMRQDPRWYKVSAWAESAPLFRRAGFDLVHL